MQDVLPISNHMEELDLALLNRDGLQLSDLLAEIQVDRPLDGDVSHLAPLNLDEQNVAPPPPLSIPSLGVNIESPLGFSPSNSLDDLFLQDSFAFVNDEPIDQVRQQPLARAPA